MSTVTDLPLHEVVLKIMFHENMEKAVPISASDILWRIDNPEISERHVTEVLDWLVRQRKAELYLGKYSIDRIEFLEQKELYETALVASEKTTNPKDKSSPKKKVFLKKPTSEKVVPEKNVPKRKTFYLNPPKIKQYRYHLYILILGVLTFGYLTYTFLDLDYSFQSSKTLEEHPQTIIDSIPNQKSLYVSEDELYTENEKNAISYSFSRQNTINTLNVKEINRLQFTLDSISTSHKNELRTLQTELQATTERSNTFIKKLMYGNFIIIVLILFLYFKKSQI
jgi:hypothetical protein